MNEILAVIVMCIYSELLSEESDSTKLGEEGEDHDLDEARQIFKTLHDPTQVWADIYMMYENLMNLGVKELYYRDNS